MKNNKFLVLATVISVLLCFTACQYNQSDPPETESVETTEGGGLHSVNTFHEDGAATVVEVVQTTGGLRRTIPVSGMRFVDEANVSVNPYPIYIRKYAYHPGGPMFEVTDEVYDFIVGRLQDYLFVLYGENVSSDEIAVPAYMSERHRVEYLRGNTSFLAGPEFTSVCFPYEELPGEVPHDITIDNLQCVDQIKAAMEYVGIRNPQMTLTVTYNLKNEPWEYYYQIFEESNQKNEYLVNCSFAYVSLRYLSGNDTVQLLMKKVEMPEIHSTPTLISLSSAADYIGQKYPDVTVSMDKVEVFYSETVVPGYFIPCYRFYVEKYSEKHSEDLGYVIEISMVSQEEIEKMMVVYGEWLQTVY